MPEEVVVGPIYAAFAKIGVSTLGILPNIVAALIILVVGVVVGRLVGMAIEEILVRLKIDSYIKAKKAEFKLSHIFGMIIRWVIYLVFVQQAADALAVPIISLFVGGIVGFMPGVLKAVVVVAAGYALARYIQELIVESKAIYSGLMSQLFFFLIVYISFALALPLVGIPADLVNNILLIIVGSVGLGFAIALGLGMKDMIRQLSMDYGKKFVKDLEKKAR
jgi:hypothetical protein